MAGLAALIGDYPLELWFGMARSEFQVMLRAIPPALARYSPAVSAMLRGFDAIRTSSELDLVPAAGLDQSTRETISFVTAGRARLAGDPVVSFRMMRGLSIVTEMVPQLVDSTRGQRAFVLLQSAISGMLAGGFVEALVLFEKSLVPPLPSDLAFFARDAHLRSAMIHALYGDRRQAQLHLDHAAAVARTESWAEDNLDSDERLVRALLAPASDARSAFRELVAVPGAHMGEMWPFYVDGIYRLALAADQRAEGRARVDQLRAAGLAPARGSGYAGSVFPATLALDALLSGLPDRAREALQAADQRLWLTRLMAAALPSTAPAKAVALGRSASDQTRGLGQAEDLRHAALALAYFGRGDERTALDNLAAQSSEPGRVPALLLEALAPGLAAAASGRTADATSDPSASGPVQFTTRELDVLGLLAKGHRRSEIAERLFLSINTVKSHQRTLYRKLGVGRAPAAILEARRRGLL